MPFLHEEFFSLLPQGTSLWCHGLMLAAGNAQLSSRVPVLCGVGELPTGALADTFSLGWMWWTFDQMVSLPKLRITISVIMHLVREVSTCRVFPSPIQREKVLSLEKKEQESHKFDILVKKRWLGLVWGAVALQMLQACGISCCSMLYCPLILLWNAFPSYCTSVMPLNGLIMFINETDVLHSVKERKEWHFNPNICFVLY